MTRRAKLMDLGHHMLQTTALLLKCKFNLLLHVWLRESHNNDTIMYVILVYFHRKLSYILLIPVLHDPQKLLLASASILFKQRK